jgi:hypothetical protein
VKRGDTDRHKFKAFSLLYPKKELHKYMVNRVTTLNSFFLKALLKHVLQKMAFIFEIQTTTKPM